MYVLMYNTARYLSSKSKPTAMPNRTLKRDCAKARSPLAPHWASQDPSSRFRYTDKFEDPNLPGVPEVTVSLKPVPCGTELNVTQSGIPEAIPVEMCYLGRQESLEQLATLVEPEIPG